MCAEIEDAYILIHKYADLNFNPMICHAFNELRRLEILDENNNYIGDTDSDEETSSDFFMSEEVIATILKITHLISKSVCDGASAEFILKFVDSIVHMNHVGMEDA